MEVPTLVDITNRVGTGVQEKEITRCALGDVALSAIIAATAVRCP